MDSRAESGLRCSTCDSPEPRLHPATQAEGEVIALCPDLFHGDPYAGGIDAPVIPPRAKVRLPESVTKLRKRSRAGSSSTEEV